MRKNLRTENKILDYAMTQFLAYGYNKITMDEIAGGIGIGKSTLYRYFASKEELIFCSIDNFFKEVEDDIQRIVDDSSMRPIEKLNAFMNGMAKRVSKFKPDILSDIERTSPDAYRRIQELRKSVILNSLVKLLKDGERSGLYRNGTDHYLVANIILASAERLSDPRFILHSAYSLQQVFHTVTQIVFKGILTDESRNLMTDTNKG